MNYQDFTRRVQSFAQIDSFGKAEAAIMATLATFAQRIPAEVMAPFAAQLPREMQASLHRQLVTFAHPFSLQEFYKRVSQREDVEPEKSAIHVRAVFAVLSSAISPQDFNQIRYNLSHDYDELFAVTASS